jgi:hypothetical protein
MVLSQKYLSLNMVIGNSPSSDGEQVTGLNLGKFVSEAAKGPHAGSIDRTRARG